MSLITSSLRLGSKGIQAVRTFSTSSSSFAAAATAPSSSTPRYVRKTAVPSRSTTSNTTSKPTPTRTSKFTPTPVPPAPVSTNYDDFPDDLPISEPIIEDYAHLSQPSASPPLTNLPGEGYSPLPAASSIAGGTIDGEAKVGEGQDWSNSFSGLSEKPFSKEIADELLRELRPQDVEIKPDGLLYLPEIKYRRTLNAAFGPGGWGLAPRGETNIGPRIVSREWGLVCLGRLVSIARGEQEYFDPSGIPTATEACKSNALMRCCKDLGIASELWDPSFIRDFKVKHCKEVFVEHATKKSKKKLWRKKDGPKFEYPWKESA
ncbi:uncharacterized protein I206_105953 [Kwoniella pini CBS 10737]|uniref:Mitochondrial genome maintenance protein MGM101 n=1 Tax=Kwoniella pini CBS 10737 TaxID=1296096 RepID=A0A1B9I0M7_9TREE|nr:mitochondrial genome maintenance protein [Kwoniella pini CBS 10737]OCF49089.1 mitochondrial genome maintenance protein [Kwoniella pini CBS 10737]